MKLCLQPGLDHRIRAIVLSIGIRYGRAPAERFLSELQRTMRRVQRFPQSGSHLHDYPGSEVRQVIVFKTYRVFYVVDTARGALWMLNIWHTAQMAAPPELPEGIRPSG
jgi:plasmid stabilization system protein ParE